MPVAANIRIAAPTGEPGTATPGEVTSIEEIFGAIIANVGEAASTPQAAAPAASADAAPATAASTAPENGVAAVVEQLLALAAGETSAKMLPEATPLDAAPTDGQIAHAPTAEAKVSAALEQLLAIVSREVAGSKIASPVEAEAIPPSDEKPTRDAPADAATVPAIAVPAVPVEPKPAVTILAAQPAAAEPKAPVITSNVALQQPAVAPEGDAPPQPPVQLAQRTDAAVQQAFSTLQAVVKELPPQVWSAALASPARAAKEQDSVSAIQELRLAAAAPLAPSVTPLASLEALRPLQAAEPLAPQSTQIDSTDFAVERHLDMAHEGEWLDQLAKDIVQTAGSDKNPLRFRLNPETLGTLRVEITQDRGGAAVRLTADTEAARTILADAQPRLVAEARAQGIRISETHVDLGSQTASGDPRRQNAAFEEAPLRTARTLREDGEGDGNPTPGRSERYA